jgi:hypothetical protein
MKLYGLQPMERSGRWLGVTLNIGDALTFWVLDDQSKQVLAQSVIRPLKFNNRVKWDPSFGTGSSRHTAQKGGGSYAFKVIKRGAFGHCYG